MERLRKFLELCPGDRRLLLQAWLWLGAIRLGMWVLPASRQGRFVARLGQGKTKGRGLDSVMADRIVRAVSTASGYVPRATCLAQALAAQVLLKQRNLPATLQIGVARDGEGKLQAHAWLESGGRVLMGGTDTVYIPLPVLEG